MREHAWTPSKHNLCEWTLPHYCGAPVAWRLQLQDARFPEFYCAECARLVAVALGITDPSRVAPLREGQPSGDLTVHAFAPEGAQTDEARAATNSAGLDDHHRSSCDE
jgi:hypothetical protein